MRKWLLAAAGACMAIGALGAPAAQAAPMSIDRLAGVQDFNLTQDVQYSYGGRRYCFYPNGWRGPGFYWCGYNFRRGLGWGGPSGWRGWGGPGPRRMERPRMERRMDMRRGPEMRRGGDMRGMRGDMRGGGRGEMRGGDRGGRGGGGGGEGRGMRGGDR
ncbi:MAG: uncharacterized protein JWN07_3588 [Hyphomicrobiales bacterium]|nr:uncharacterized protein [Hyphomicrobiales bacterium]